MIRIKKVTFILMLIIALIAGSVGMCFYMGIDVEDLIFASQGVVSVPKGDYEYYQGLATKYGKLDSFRNYILQKYYIDVPEEDLDDAILHGVFDPLDQYSYYMNEEELEGWSINLTGKYSGVGLTISVDDSGYIVVVSPIDGSPAEQAGIKTGDYILKVDGVDYTDEQLNEAAAAMRGEADTKVVVTVRHKNEIKDYELIRKDIVQKSVSYEIKEDGIGYIRLSQFMEETGKEFSEALANVEYNGAKALVIDLRSNGGGLVDQCISVADHLMNKGTVVYTEDRAGKREYYTTNNGRTTLPFVVLVDGGTASASEILSAGVQDNNEGIIVGTQTFGKGIIQQSEPLSDGTGITMTVMQYFSPNGNPIHKVGITPDYVVELTDDCFDEDGVLVNDLQYNKAVELLLEQISEEESAA